MTSRYANIRVKCDFAENGTRRFSAPSNASPAELLKFIQAAYPSLDFSDTSVYIYYVDNEGDYRRLEHIADLRDAVHSSNNVLKLQIRKYPEETHRKFKGMSFKRKTKFATQSPFCPPSHSPFRYLLSATKNDALVELVARVSNSLDMNELDKQRLFLSRKTIKDLAMTFIRNFISVSDPMDKMNEEAVVLFASSIKQIALNAGISKKTADQIESIATMMASDDAIRTAALRLKRKRDMRNHNFPPFDRTVQPGVLGFDWTQSVWTIIRLGSTRAISTAFQNLNALGKEAVFDRPKLLLLCEIIKRKVIGLCLESSLRLWEDLHWLLSDTVTTIEGEALSLDVSEAVSAGLSQCVSALASETDVTRMLCWIGFARDFVQKCGYPLYSSSSERDQDDRLWHDRRESRSLMNRTPMETVVQSIQSNEARLALSEMLRCLQRNPEDRPKLFYVRRHILSCVRDFFKCHEENSVGSFAADIRSILLGAAVSPISAEAAAKLSTALAVDPGLRAVAFDELQQYTSDENL